LADVLDDEFVHPERRQATKHVDEGHDEADSPESRDPECARHDHALERAETGGDTGGAGQPRPIRDHAPQNAIVPQRTERGDRRQH
jgi:hypothetical protein